MRYFYDPIAVLDDSGVISPRPWAVKLQGYVVLLKFESRATSKALALL